MNRKKCEWKFHTVVCRYMKLLLGFLKAQAQEQISWISSVILSTSDSSFIRETYSFVDRFVRSNISNVDLNYVRLISTKEFFSLLRWFQAVVETLDILVVETPPLLMYDAERRVWIYIPPAPDFKSNERIEMSKLSSVDEKPLKTENVPVTSLQNLLYWYPRSLSLGLDYFCYR